MSTDRTPGAGTVPPGGTPTADDLQAVLSQIGDDADVTDGDDPA